MTYNKIIQSVIFICAAMLLNACNNALIYSEGTNFSLASIKLNDEVAQPISINAGLDRTVATISPPKKAGGNAINMVSGFKLDHNDQGMFGTLTIKTSFASGKAGKQLAASNPAAAARIMNTAFVVPDSSELRRRKGNAIEYVKGEQDAEKLKKIAGRMGVADYRPDPKDGIIDALSNADANRFNDYTRIIKEELGQPF